MKVGGENPNRFGETVMPVTEVFDLYAQPVRAAATLTIAGGSVSSLTSTLTPPKGYAYRVLTVGTSNEINAADVALKVTTIISVVSLATAVTDIMPFYAAETVGTPLFRKAGLALPHPLFIPPGFAIAFTVDTSAVPANNLATTISALVQQIPL